VRYAEFEDEELVLFPHDDEATHTAYIAGPITGMPNFNIEGFRAAARELVRAGWRAVDPHTLHDVAPGVHPDEVYYRRDLIAMLDRCDAVVVLPGWEESRGAQTEVHVAVRCGMPVYALADLTRPLTPDQFPPALAGALLVHGDRKRDYAHPSTNFVRIARGWEVIFGTTVSNRQVGQALAWLKIARDVGTPKHDNLVDLAGYAEATAMAAKE
jgi:hypothetical protein